MAKAVFLDRDGVINHDPGDYTMSLDEFTVLPDVFVALRKLQDHGFKLILITNQGGIAKGLYTHAVVHDIHTSFRRDCAEHGVVFADIFYAPSHPEYWESLFRKPDSMMIERAIAKHGVDASKSWIIGDKQRDLDAGAKAGVQGLLMETNGSLLERIQPILQAS